MKYDKIKDLLFTVIGSLLLFMFNDMRGAISAGVSEMTQIKKELTAVTSDVVLTKQIINAQGEVLRDLSQWPLNQWTRSDQEKYDQKVNDQFLRIWGRIYIIENKTGINK